MLSRSAIRAARTAVRGRVTAQRAMSSQSTEWFPFVDAVKYEGPDSTNPLAFKHYNPQEEVHGRTMEEWCRFSVCWWHTFRGTGMDPFGAGTIVRPWDDGSESMENALRRVDAAFEFFKKLGVPYYTFHDVDVAPATTDLAEFNDGLDQVAEKLWAKQQETGVKLLWGTANLFSHPRYMNGGMTNPDFAVFARAAAQVKKAMEVTHRLGGENYVFWGGREGYQTILNTRPRQELDNAAAFFRAAVAHKQSLGADYQLLIEPKPREPTKHQYDYDAQTVIGFLKTYGLDDHFKINVEPNHTTLAGHSYEHDIIFSSAFGMLGSIDANTGDELLGWDTDQFPSNVKQTALTMGTILDQGGLAPGGLNFDCKVRRESTDLEDFFIAHIGAMDAFAKGLRAAAAMRKEGRVGALVQERYASWESDVAKKAAQGQIGFAELEQWVKDNGEPEQKSGKQELFEMEWARHV